MINPSLGRHLVFSGYEVYLPKIYGSNMQLAAIAV